MAPDSEKFLLDRQALFRTRTGDPFLTIDRCDHPGCPGGSHAVPPGHTGSPDATGTPGPDRTEAAEEDHPNAPRTPPGRFLTWLAGFIDGEGCFAIQHRPDGGYATTFRLCLRDDDEAILREIAARIGIGGIYNIGVSGNSNPQAAWQLSSKGDCLTLVGILDEHPLRSRKAQDYMTWRAAVLEWHRPRRRGSRWPRRAGGAGPATAICGDPRVSPPGYRGRADDYAEDGSYVGERSMDNAVRVTLAEALVLQSFPPDYPVQGTKTKQFEQVGNAVPPLLAWHVLRALGLGAAREGVAA